MMDSGVEPLATYQTPSLAGLVEQLFLQLIPEKIV
jgi:hypothetical protein